MQFNRESPHTIPTNFSSTARSKLGIAWSLRDSTGLNSGQLEICSGDGSQSFPVIVPSLDGGSSMFLGRATVPRSSADRVSLSFGCGNFARLCFPGRSSSPKFGSRGKGKPRSPTDLQASQIRATQGSELERRKAWAHSMEPRRMTSDASHFALAVALKLMCFFAWCLADDVFSNANTDGIDCMINFSTRHDAFRFGRQIITILVTRSCERHKGIATNVTVRALLHITTSNKMQQEAIIK